MSKQPSSKLFTSGVCVLLAVLLVAGGLLLVVSFKSRDPANNGTPDVDSIVEATRAHWTKNPRSFAAGKATLWWDAVPENVRSYFATSTHHSNIRPRDYVGPEKCEQCHQENHANWSQHPHRWMNAVASDATVKGNFSGEASIQYLGGIANFYEEDDRYLMRLNRDNLQRTYVATRTIGSRFFQYYVGRQIDGPEPKNRPLYKVDHVLPFGYWLVREEWVPVVHIEHEQPDGERIDPFDPPKDKFFPYATTCNACHTTFPFGDMIGRFTHQTSKYSPFDLHLNLFGYLQESHSRIIGTKAHPADFQPEEINEVKNMLRGMEAPKYAVTLGVSCEACHLGAEEHVKSGGKELPRFFPESPDLFVDVQQEAFELGRTQINVNWACGRCHLGGRPLYAGGMSTWNSVEYADARLGSCYSQLRCIDCHDPHRGIGQKWPLSGQQDDALCIKCHQQYEVAEARLRHTHHPDGSEGARCMNCHMPRVNEGMQDLVRTHMIYSPTRSDMIEANHPNACNMCHADQSIDWTLKYLDDWYGKEFQETKIAANYSRRDGSAAAGWLKSENEAVRLVGADVLIRTRNMQELPDLLGALDDPYLINRQFATRGIEDLIGRDFTEFGYRFYMTPDERQGPLAKLRAELLRTNSASQSD